MLFFWFFRYTQSMPAPLHHHTGHPFVALCAVVAGAAFLLASSVQPTEAASSKTFTHPADTFSFAYPSPWKAKTGTKTVALTPTTSQLAALKSRGVNYALNVGYLNRDTAVMTTGVKSTLSKSWSSFVATYAKILAKRYGATYTTTNYPRSGWNSSAITLKARVNGVATTWRVIVQSKDRKAVYALTEKWTKQSSSPFASAVSTIAKSLTPFSLVSWQHSDKWAAIGTPPTCAQPFSIQSPVDLSLATSILYPGQSRGGNYKPHGGFRFDTSASTDIVVRAPFDGKLVNGARYIENGHLQYLFTFIHPCGFAYRFDHLAALSSTMATQAAKLPAAEVDNTQTMLFPDPITVKAGDIIATAVGYAGTTNTSVDFGLYDLRQTNPISSNAEWAAAHSGIKEYGWHGVCWFDHLSSADEAIVRGLPPADQNSGAASDYCQ